MMRRISEGMENNHLRVARRMRLAMTIVPRAAAPPARAMPMYPSIRYR
jgi:hypothetical protein